MNAQRLRWTLLPVAVSLAACGTLLSAPRPSAPLEALERCGFPPGTELAFAGMASPFELGLGYENETTAAIHYVTARPVRRTDKPDLPPQRWSCTFTDVSGGWGNVPAGWTPPANVEGR